MGVINNRNRPRPRAAGKDGKHEFHVVAAPLETPESVVPGIPLTSHKVVKYAHTVLTGTAEFQRLPDIVHGYLSSRPPQLWSRDLIGLLTYRRPVPTHHGSRS